VSEQNGTTPTTTEPGAGGAAEPEGGDQIGQLLEGFNTFKGEVMGRIDGLERDLFEPEDGDEPLAGAPTFPAVPGQQPAPVGQPTFPVQPGAPAPGYPDPGQQQVPGQPAPVAPQIPADAAQVLDQFISQRVQASQQQLDQRMQAAFSAQERQRELDAYADSLESKYDEFKDEETTKRLLDSTAAFAQQLGHPELASDPRLLERVLVHERAQVAAAGGGEQREVHLETTPAAPGGSPGEVDPAAGIVAAAAGKRLM
jgi:hypothetical protein